MTTKNIISSVSCSNFSSCEILFKWTQSFSACFCSINIISIEVRIRRAPWVFNFSRYSLWRATFYRTIFYDFSFFVLTGISWRKRIRLSARLKFILCDVRIIERRVASCVLSRRMSPFCLCAFDIFDLVNLSCCYVLICSLLRLRSFNIFMSHLISNEFRRRYRSLLKRWQPVIRIVWISSKPSRIKFDTFRY